MAESIKGQLKTAGKKLLVDAIRHKNVKEVQLIIDDLEKNGQDLASIVNSDKCIDNCILLLAMKTKKADLVDLLLSKGLCTEDKKIKDLLVHEAIEIGDLSVMQKLSEHGFLQQSICDHETPPLFELVAQRNLPWILLFYRAGVSFNEKNKQGQPLLHFALSKWYSCSKKRLFRLLFYWGVNLEDRNAQDLTPLHFLASIGRKRFGSKVCSLAKLLLTFGANPNAWSESLQRSVLETAVLSNRSKLVQILVTHGAHLNAVNWRPTLKHFVSKGNEDGISVIAIEYMKLRYLNKISDPGYRILKHELGGFFDIHEMLLDELVSLKITDDVKALDIMTANESQLSRFMRNPKIYEFIDSHKNPKNCLQFSAFNWSYILEFQAKKGRERDILRKRCEQPFREILKWKAAPVLVVDEILSYLSYADLVRFYMAFHRAGFLEKLIPMEIEKSEVECENIPTDIGEETDDYESYSDCETDSFKSLCIDHDNSDDDSDSDDDSVDNNYDNGNNSNDNDEDFSYFYFDPDKGVTFEVTFRSRAYNYDHELDDDDDDDYDIS